MITVIAAIILFLLILSSAVVIALNARFVYYHDIKALGISEQSGLPEAVIKHNYDVLVDYNQIWTRSELQLPDFVMSEGGRIHFREVKVIFDIFQLLFVLTLAAYTVMRLKIKSLADKRHARLCGYICFSITGALGIFAMIGFDRLFTAFHHVFFRNDYWIFDASSDPVITILPETFFLHEALLILGIVLLGGLSAFLLGLKAKKKTQ